MFFRGGSYVGEFRGKRYLFQKPHDVFRIVTLGGSTTAGIVGDTETWPHHLEERLNVSDGYNDLLYANAVSSNYLLSARKTYELL